MVNIRRISKLLRGNSVFVHKNSFLSLPSLLREKGYCVTVATSDLRFTQGPVDTAYTEEEDIVYLRDSHEPSSWTKHFLSRYISDEEKNALLIGPKKSSKKLLDFFDVRKRFYTDGLLVAKLGQQEEQYSLKEYTFKECVDGVCVDFITAKGLFSYSHLDHATRFLLETITLDEKSTVLDFGVGYGAITCFLAKKYDESRFVGIDSTEVAVEYAKKNVLSNGVDERVNIEQAYLLSSVSKKVDAVVCNPPTHISQGEARTVFQQMKDVLKEGGVVFMVVNKAVQYESLLEPIFGRVGLVGERGKFKILSVKK